MELRGTVRWCGHIAGREVWYVSNTVHADWYLIDLKQGLLDCGRLSDLERVWGRMIPIENEGTRVRINFDTGEVRTAYSKSLWCAFHPKGSHGNGWVTTYRKAQVSK